MENENEIHQSTVDVIEQLLLINGIKTNEFIDHEFIGLAKKLFLNQLPNLERMNINRYWRMYFFNFKDLGVDCTLVRYMLSDTEPTLSYIDLFHRNVIPVIKQIEQLRNNNF